MWLLGIMKVRLEADAIVISIDSIFRASSWVKCSNGFIVNVFYIAVAEPASMFIYNLQ